MYASLDDKKELFIYNTVSTFQMLCQTLERYQKLGYCFRGQQNALWEVVSSAQRSWNEWRCRECVVAEVDYQHYLSMALEYAKQNIKFPSCNLKCRKNGLRDHERWGYLQHYSWPTPFIDFSNNMDVALFMAVRNVSYLQTDGCLSIYIIDPEFTDGNENYDLDQFVRNESGNDEELYSFNKWGHMRSWIIHKNRASWCPEVSRGRIASQGGMFVYLYSADSSLEEEFAQWNKFKNREVDRVKGTYHYPITCIDVPYSIVPQVKAYLFDKGVNAESMGLADESRDGEIRTQYGEFEKYFLSNCKKDLQK